MSKFSEDIRSFAMSVDIVSDATYKEVMVMIGQWFSNHLGFGFVEILREEFDRSNGAMLQTEWTKNSNLGTLSDPIVQKDGTYATQTAFVFANKKPSWIVAKDQGLLSDTSEYIDYWNSQSGFPQYQSANEFDVKTSVILPIIRKNRVWGVFNIESDNYLGKEIADGLKEEIFSVVESFAVFTDLHDATITQNTNTSQMVRQLEKSLDKQKRHRVGKPTIFIASSSNADKKIIAKVRKVLDTQSIRAIVKPIFWQDIKTSGDINVQILKHIESCSYGICYFSELAEDSTSFIDNPNVLFEAGMLHAKREINSTTPLDWIPIREKKSPKIPFDISNERFIIVPRLNDGKINGEEFEEELLARILEMIGTKKSS